MSKLTLQNGTAGSVLRRRSSLAAILLIIGLTGLASAWALPRVAAAAAQWAAAPPVKARTVRLADGLAVSARASSPAARVGAAASAQPDAVSKAGADGRIEAGAGALPDGLQTVHVEPGASFDMVGVLVDGPVPQRGVVVWLRTSADGVSWGEWFALDLQSLGRRGGPRASTDPVWVGESRHVEIAAEGLETSTLEGVRVMTIDTTGGDSTGDQVVAAVRRAVAVIAAASSPPEAGAMTTTPTIVTRTEWGANESWKASDGPYYAPVKMAFVHHTVNANGYTRAQAPGIMRGIYYYDVYGNHWNDFGYNFAVDRYGTIYEGRAGGMTKGVIGAQVLGFNTSSTGIAMIGTFSTVKPPSAMIASLERLLAWKLDVHHVDPAGTARMLCRSSQKFREGETVTFPAIAGHRQANYTACPGDVLYHLLPTIRDVVARTGLPKIYAYRFSTAVISPNSDGTLESTRVRFTNSTSAEWTLRVKDAAGVVVRSFAGVGGTVDQAWSGRDDAGGRVPDGTYTVTARASAAGAQARAAAGDVIVDTVAPAASAVGTKPAVFSPNGDGYGDTSHVLFTTSEACSARVLVVDEAGAALRVVAGWRYAAAGAWDVRWDGRVDGSAGSVPAAEGQVRFRIELKDTGGNAGTASATTVLDRTLGFARATPAVFSPNGDQVKDASSLGFRLTRKADCVVVVRSGDQTVRTFKLGSLAAGSHAVGWDGRRGDGTVAPNGLYRWSVTAGSSLGEVAAADWVSVDLYRPRLSAATGVTVKLGERARVRFTARDPYSATVRVTATVRNRAGTVVATIDRGWVKQGVQVSVAWKPPRRRTYSVRFTAVDRAGNPQYAAAKTTITVR